MRIPEDKLESIERNLVHLNLDDLRPPRAFLTALLAVVDPDKLLASWAEWDPQPNTHWRAWLLTGSALAFVHLEFDELAWHRDEEDRFYRHMESRPAVTHEASVRPLGEVSEVDIVQFGEPTGNEREELPLNVVLKFRDGSRIELPQQLDRHRLELVPINEFTSAVRARIPFWHQD